ncbi:MAG: hypothetical protein V4736_10330 [Bdellovibrionota bacterium]
MSNAVKIEPPKKEREFADPQSSTKSGASGFAETFLRRFKNLGHLALILPVYGVACVVMGSAAAPGFWMFNFIQSFAESSSGPLYYFLSGVGFVAGYFTYGFSLIFLIPALNFIIRGYLKPWRGPYYSLEAIRWYLHNGITYAVRYTFLEFITPTPFNLLFYRMMGMKIGKGTNINSTWISDASLITMGDKVTIGGSAAIVGHYGQAGYLILAPVTIGDGATIGLKATIMGGVTIGANARILPNSVVLPKTQILDGETWGGVPARKLDIV